ncbi:MAG: hypothetical protein ACTSVI_14700 [Promethearchaeota archaeon]
MKVQLDLRTTIEKLMIHVGSVVCGFISPFIVISRLRMTYGNFNALDWIILVSLIIGPILVFIILENHYYKLMLASFVILAVVSLLSFLLLPVMQFPENLMPSISIVGGGEIHASSVISGVFAGFGFLVFSCFIKFLETSILNNDSRGKIIIFLSSITVAGCISLPFIFWLKNSNAVYLLTSLFAAATVFVISLFLASGKKTIKENLDFYEDIDRLRRASIIHLVNRKQRAHLNLIGFIEWLLSTVYLLGTSFIFFVLLQEVREHVKLSLFLINLVSGAIICLLLVILMKNFKAFTFLLPLLSTGAMITLFAIGYFFSLNLVKFFIPGLAFISIIIHFMVLNISIDTRNSISLLLSWLVSAYLGFIPAKPNEVFSLHPWIYLILSISCVILLVQSWRFNVIRKTTGLLNNEQSTLK